MVLKLFFVSVLALACSLLVSGCDGASPSAPDGVTYAEQAARKQADANAKQSAADIAARDAQVANAVITAVRQQTEDAKTRVAFDAAHAKEMAAIAETSQANLNARVDVEKTESARAAETWVAVKKTATVEAEILRASKTGTAVAETVLTETAIAHVPTEVESRRLAKQTADARTNADALAVIKNKTDLDNAVTLRTIELYLPLVGWGVFSLAVALTILLLGQAGTRWLDARTLEKSTKAVSGLVPVIDDTGFPIGFWQPIGPSYQFVPIVYKEFAQPQSQTQPEPRAPLFLRDSVEYKALPAGAGSEPPKQAEDVLIQDMIYPSDLKVFTLAILGLTPAEDDWTQKRWRDWKLPRGFVLSMDTQNSEGDTLIGGYRRLIQLFVNAHLIINRTDTTMGEWNPNAPREIGKVLDILEGKVRAPDLPAPKRGQISAEYSLDENERGGGIESPNYKIPSLAASARTEIKKTTAPPPTPPRRRVSKRAVKVS